MPWDGQTYTGDPILAVIDWVDRLICDEEHWGQGYPGKDGYSLSPSTGRHCPITALFWQGIGMDACNLAEPYFAKAVYGIKPDTRREQWPVPGYNNAPERTFADIKALIRKARELRLADIMETVDA